MWLFLCFIVLGYNLLGWQIIAIGFMGAHSMTPFVITSIIISSLFASLMWLAAKKSYSQDKQTREAALVISIILPFYMPLMMLYGAYYNYEKNHNIKEASIVLHLSNYTEKPVSIARNYPATGLLVSFDVDQTELVDNAIALQVQLFNPITHTTATIDCSEYSPARSWYYFDGMRVNLASPHEDIQYLCAPNIITLMELKRSQLCAVIKREFSGRDGVIRQSYLPEAFGDNSAVSLSLQVYASDPDNGPVTVSDRLETILPPDAKLIDLNYWKSILKNIETPALQKAGLINKCSVLRSIFVGRPPDACYCK